MHAPTFNITIHDHEIRLQNNCIIKAHTVGEPEFTVVPVCDAEGVALRDGVLTGVDGGEGDAAIGKPILQARAYAQNGIAVDGIYACNMNVTRTCEQT